MPDVSLAYEGYQNLIKIDALFVKIKRVMLASSASLHPLVKYLSLDMHFYPDFLLRIFLDELANSKCRICRIFTTIKPSSLGGMPS